MIDSTSIPDVEIADASRPFYSRCRAGEPYPVSPVWDGKRALCWCPVCRGKRELGEWLCRALGAEP